MNKKRSAKEILSVDPKPTISLRLPVSLIDFLDEQVKLSKVKSGTRSALIEGILIDWSSSKGYKRD
jgi:hypothetical protein